MPAPSLPALAGCGGLQQRRAEGQALADLAAGLPFVQPPLGLETRAKCTERR